MTAVPAACALFTLVVGAVALVGWWFRIDLVRSLVPGTVGVKANTALGFLLTGASLYLQQRAGKRDWLRRVAGVFCVIVVLIGAVTLAEFATGRDLWIDGLLVHPSRDSDFVTVIPGRMALGTALSFTLIGLALASGRRAITGRLRVAEVLITGPVALSFLVLLAYLYGAPEVYNAAAFTPLALPTAMTFLVLSVGIVVGVQGVTTSVFTTSGSQRLFAIRMIPAGIAVLVVLGWVRVQGQRAGLYETEAGVAIAVVVGTFALLALSAWTGRALHRLEAQREREVRRFNRELEARVHERTNELERANHELEAFSYSVSHDLRSPLRAIAGYGRIVSEDHAALLDGEGRRLLGVIESEAARMGRLIDDLLQFSRLGRQAISWRTIDMTALAREVFLSLEGHERVAQFTLAALPTVGGDLTLLRLVWMNLLGNAVKFTSRTAAPHIEVGAERSDDAITYWVRDNGAGFDSRYAHKLFGVFQRLHRDEEFEGTGIGLAQVQRIVQRHGGTVRAEGALDQGATLFFSLPIAPEQQP